MIPPSSTANRRRDIPAAVGLFVTTAAFVLWQNSRVAVLWDLSYLLDISHRIALGQVPYRDFPLVHPPLTFLIQAALERLGGRHYFLTIGYAAAAGGLGTVLAWRIILRVLQIPMAWTISLLLAAPLCFVGIYSIYPHPIYDCDCALAILLAILLLQRCLADIGRGWRSAGVAGLVSVLPVFFKQNIGGQFLMAVVAGLLVLLGARWWSRDAGALPERAILVQVLCSILAGVAVGLVLIQSFWGLGNYLRWTVHFAAERRLPGLGEMFAVYRQPSFVWTLPAFAAGLLLLHTRLAARWWGKALALGLAAAPFAGSLVFLILDDDLDERADNLLALWPLLLLACGVMAILELRKGLTVGRILPFFVLAAIHGTFLSQQLWGSTYAIWPLLMILVAYLLGALPLASGWARPALAAMICTTFAVCGGLYAAGHERLNYAQIPDAPIMRAALPALHGMSTSGPYIPDFEELVRFAEQEIPPRDGILLLPGEEPFYYATGSTPQFPVQIFDHTTDPYSAEELMAEARRRGIQWVVVKTRLQSNEDPLPERERTMQLVKSEFRLEKRLAGYDVYRRL
jgi:hypothetical protein